jgi:Ca2+-binding protein (EF-Hand superfamily)
MVRFLFRLYVISYHLDILIAIVHNFNATKTKEVIEKKKTQDDVFKEFLSNFRLDINNGVSKKEFFDYYTDLGVSIPSDNYFSELVQNTWDIVEDKESTISVEEIKDIIKTLRYKLIQLSKGSQDEFLLRKLFKEFDISNSGYLTLDDLSAMMVRLEAPLNPNYLAAVFSYIDKNKSGYVEFEEFVNLVVNNPFP